MKEDSNNDDDKPNYDEDVIKYLSSNPSLLHTTRLTLTPMQKQLHLEKQLYFFTSIIYNFEEEFHIPSTEEQKRFVRMQLCYAKCRETKGKDGGVKLLQLSPRMMIDSYNERMKLQKLYSHCLEKCCHENKKILTKEETACDDENALLMGKEVLKLEQQEKIKQEADLRRKKKKRMKKKMKKSKKQQQQKLDDGIVNKHDNDHSSSPSIPHHKSNTIEHQQLQCNDNKRAFDDNGKVSNLISEFAVCTEENKADLEAEGKLNHTAQSQEMKDEIDTKQLNLSKTKMSTLPGLRVKSNDKITPTKVVDATVTEESALSSLSKDLVAEVAAFTVSVVNPSPKSEKNNDFDVTEDSGDECMTTNKNENNTALAASYLQAAAKSQSTSQHFLEAKIKQQQREHLERVQQVQLKAFIAETRALAEEERCDFLEDLLSEAIVELTLEKPFQRINGSWGSLLDEVVEAVVDMM